jgi:hypothetical protein
MSLVPPIEFQLFSMCLRAKIISLLVGKVLDVDPIHIHQFLKGFGSAIVVYDA